MTEPLIKLPSVIEDELRAEIANQKNELASKDAEIAEQKSQLAGKDAELECKDAELERKDAEIRSLQELVIQLSTNNTH